VRAQCLVQPRSSTSRRPDVYKVWKTRWLSVACFAHVRKRFYDIRRYSHALLRKGHCSIVEIGRLQIIEPNRIPSHRAAINYPVYTRFTRRQFGFSCRAVGLSSRNRQACPVIDSTGHLKTTAPHSDACCPVHLREPSSAVAIRHRTAALRSHWR